MSMAAVTRQHADRQRHLRKPPNRHFRNRRPAIHTAPSPGIPSSSAVTISSSLPAITGARSMRTRESAHSPVYWRAGGVPGSHGPANQTAMVSPEGKERIKPNGIHAKTNSSFRSPLTAHCSIQASFPVSFTLSSRSAATMAFRSMRSWDSDRRKWTRTADGLPGSHGPANDIASLQTIGKENMNPARGDAVRRGRSDADG